MLLAKGRRRKQQQATEKAESTEKQLRKDNQHDQRLYNIQKEHLPIMARKWLENRRLVVLVTERAKDADE